MWHGVGLTAPGQNVTWCGFDQDRMWHAVGLTGTEYGIVCVTLNQNWVKYIIVLDSETVLKMCSIDLAWNN